MLGVESHSVRTRWLLQRALSWLSCDMFVHATPARFEMYAYLFASI